MAYKHAFVSCARHKQFMYACHGCLVATVAMLCEILDEQHPAPVTYVKKRIRKKTDSID